MKAANVLGMSVAVWLLAGSTAFADVQVTMQDGRVSIVAKDATLRQILTEWARVGQTKIVNVERIPGGPMTLELQNVTEDHALDILLRSLSGYLAAPRPTPAPNLSRFDRILVMPTVAAARQVVATSAPPPPVFQQAPPPMPTDVDTDDERGNPNVAVPNPANPRGPVFSTFPQPQVVNPGAVPVNVPQGGYVPPPGMTMPGAPAAAAPPTTTPSGFPTGAAGVARPGMMVPAPPAPTIPPPTVVPRRPGGAQGQ